MSTGGVGAPFPMLGLGSYTIREKGVLFLRVNYTLGFQAGFPKPDPGRGAPAQEAEPGPRRWAGAG